MLLIEKVGSSDALEEKLKILNGNLPSRIITTHDLCNVIEMRLDKHIIFLVPPHSIERLKSLGD